ncbi:hypothetical protein RvY_11354-2 [Ramazzottius varieornatus]|nr:hypothetical protein RvY_11354-2 [Ramazzottius varieornatus]
MAQKFYAMRSLSRGTVVSWKFAPDQLISVAVPSWTNSHSQFKISFFSRIFRFGFLKLVSRRYGWETSASFVETLEETDSTVAILGSVNWRRMDAELSGGSCCKSSVED